MVGLDCQKSREKNNFDTLYSSILCFTAPGNSDEDFTLATWTAVDTGTIAVSWEYF